MSEARPQVVVAMFHPEYVLRLSNADGSPAVTLHLDLTLEFHEGYDPDDAARRFWEDLAAAAPHGSALRESVLTPASAASEEEPPDMAPHAPIAHHLQENRAPAEPPG